MSKRNFTAAFWFMFVLGIIAASMSGYALYSLIHILPLSYQMSLFYKMTFFFLPAIMLIEAMMYWIVRKKDIHRRTAWSHVLLFSFAYSTLFLKELLFLFYDNFTPAADETSYINYVNRGQIWLFWGLTVTAHIFFVRVLVKAFSKKPAVQQEAIPSENMLDDILD
jgi:hypothetical protein